jgi:Xaa-Pro aminopeptidase
LTLTRPNWAGRLQKLQRALVEQELDAFVASHPASIAYLSGFSGSTSLLVVFVDRATLVTDGRYEFGTRAAIAEGSVADVSMRVVDRRYELTLGAVVEEARVRRVGFDASHLTVALLGAWQRVAPSIEWCPTEQIVERLRGVKDASEIAIYRRGGRMMDEVVGQLPEILRNGGTEADVARAIEAALVAAGFEGAAFPTIVASGPNSALPHARPGPRRLVQGDLVVLDFGGVLDGYCLDLTRAAAVGSVTSEARTLYEAVRAAHAAALAAVVPGAQTSTIDAAARGVLERRGLGHAFLHSTGHGLGLEIHEWPRLARAEAGPSDAIEPGMIFTVEPGAYVEGLGGVRLEDDVLVTNEGSEVLTKASLDLLLV